MAKRFTDTEKWNDDWYISLSNDYRIIWQWLLDNCNHAGICKRSIRLLNLMCNTAITEDELILVMDSRVIINNGNWFIPKFIKFQYSTLNSKKPAIVSVVKELEKAGIADLIPKSFGNDYIIIRESLGNDSEIIKDKDKDKDTVKDKDSIKGEKEINQFPTFETFEGVLTESDKLKAIEVYKIRKYVMLTMNQVDDMFKAFKIQNLTGKKFYETPESVINHFKNWLPTQRIDAKAKSETEEYNPKAIWQAAMDKHSLKATK